MAPTKILLIRHGEKPIKTQGKKFAGVDETGDEDKQDLSVRGWQRAGALCRLFFPTDGHFADRRLEKPTRIYAPHPNDLDPSVRARHTIAPLARFEGLDIDDSFGVGDEKQLAKAILKHSGVALIAWEHKHIRDIVHAMTQGTVGTPRWPKDRFDMVFVLIRTPAWSLEQVPQMLLPGDSAAIFAADK